MDRASTLIKPNPALQRGFESSRFTGVTTGDTMTISGAVNCTALFMFVLIAAAWASWTYLPLGAGIGAVLVAALAGIYTSFVPKHAQFSGFIYAIFEGIAVGAISRVYNENYDGVVLQAFGLTVAITAALLAIYRTGAIKVTHNFRLGVAAATLGLMLFYVVDLIVGLFGANLPLVHSSSTFGIIFSVLVVALASANLVVDFDFIEQGAEQGLPKYMEWYGAFGLMVTIVWLYLELLRLLSKLRNN